MEKTAIAPNIIDNTAERELVRVIKDQLVKSKQAKFAIGYFFLSGFSLVKNDFPVHIPTYPFLRIVMGNETTYPTKEELVKGYELREIIKQRMIEDLQKQELTDEQKERLRHLRDFIAHNVIDVRLFDKSRLHAKLYLFITKPEEKYGSPGLAVVGSSNFTAEGLTLNKELNVLLTSREEVLYLDEWFEHLWEDAIEFREDLLKVIDISGVLPDSPYPKAGKLVDPHTLFKYLVYRWFEGRILNLLKKDILMEFQLVGTINAVDKLNFYNGVILADSVGLGKSFMASAVIEEFLHGKHPAWCPPDKKPAVLLILPPSIIPQWEELLIDSDYFLCGNKKKIRKDQDNYKMYEIYDASERLLGKLTFLSLGLFQNMEDNELEKIREDYDLIVIDEAHKYRNPSTNRWRNVRKLQKKESGFPNKFLLLTATPLNNSIHDIFSLIRLFTDDTFAPFRIKGVRITELMQKYRNLKKELSKRDDTQIKKELKKIATEIKHKVLDEIMILRTRKYIMEQFQDMKVDGKRLIFTDPIPHSLNYSSFYKSEYKNLLKAIKNNLERILFEYTKLYGTKFVVFEETTVDEEEPQKRLIEVSDLFKLLLGKRLESGIFPFETTLRRIYEKERVFYESFKTQINGISKAENIIELIQKAIKKAKIEKELEEITDEYSVEEEREETWFDRVVKILHEYANESKETGKQYSEIELLKLGLRRVTENLQNDLKHMEEIFTELNKLKNIQYGEYITLGRIPKQGEDIRDLPIYTYKDDPKLEALKQIIGSPSYKSDKLGNIPSLHRKKIIIFTQYKDTAYYLYHNLLEWVKKEVDLHTWLKDEHDRIKMALVTGETETSTKMNFIRRFAPQANNGFEEIKKFGEIEILISTDALSEGVNLQDADAVINYDLPWNPMIIVQRVGRVNRIGNEKDVFVINFIPSYEVEIIVGVLRKLKEKIHDITLIVGKDIKILSPEEEINIETFGERIKSISELSMTKLEEFGISDDFREFIPEGIPQEQLDEYKLLNIIQYDLGFTTEDFKDVIHMGDGPYYSFIQGNDTVVSVYEFYRGKYKIMKKVMTIEKNGEIEYKTPLVFLNLIKKRSRAPRRIEYAIENLKKMKDKTEAIVEKLKEGYQQEQKGFLYNLYNALLVERMKAVGMEDTFKVVMTVLQTIPYYLYAKEVKALLTGRGLIEVNKNQITLKDFKGVIHALHEYFRQRGLANIESLKVDYKHAGWYYEI